MLKNHTLVPVMMLMSAGTESSAPKKKYPGKKTYMFRVQLRDKSGTPYSLARPSAYLSQKAIERRARQHIAIDSTDLPVSMQYEKMLEKQGTSVVSKSKWNNTVVVMTSDTLAANKLKQLPFVVGVRKVWTSPDSITLEKPRPQYHKELVLHDTVDVDSHGATQEQLAMLGGQTLHSQGYRGKGMTIAVLDAGFTNADLIPAFINANIVGFQDFVVPSRGKMFNSSTHGTQVLSTMAVNVPDVYVGAAPEASYWLLRCEDQQSEQPWKKTTGLPQLNMPTAWELTL